MLDASKIVSVEISKTKMVEILTYFFNLPSFSSRENFWWVLGNFIEGEIVAFHKIRDGGWIIEFILYAWIINECLAEVRSLLSPLPNVLFLPFFSASLSLLDSLAEFCPARTINWNNRCLPGKGKTRELLARARVNKYTCRSPFPTRKNSNPTSSSS